jgi:hypothetical protein
VKAIGEELSEDSLAQSNSPESVPMRVAKALKLSHCFCDPSTEERKRLGLALDHNSVEIGAWLKQGSTPESINAEVAVEHRKRERVWLERLHAFDIWPTLFVCGANHTHGFAAMLEGHGVRVEVAAEDWEPIDAAKARE